MTVFAVALHAYLSVLAGADSPARAAAIDSLAASGDVAAVAGAVATGNWRVRDGLFDALERMGDVAVDSLVSIAAHHPRVDAQRLAIRGLGRVGSAAALNYLLALSDSPHRDMAAEALGKIKDARAVGFLRKLLKDAHPDVRRRAALALLQVAGDRAAEDLAALLDDRHHGVRVAVANALADRHGAAGAAALRRWEDFGFAGRFAAIGLWKRLRYAPAIPVLIRMLGDRDWALRAASADALGAVGAAQNRLAMALMREQHPYVKARLQAAMGTSKDGLNRE